MRRVWLVLLVSAITLASARADATVVRRLDVAVRGKTLTLTVYRAAAQPRGTVLMGSGDVGWVGLGVSMAEFLADQGYTVAGINVRQYLSVFTAGKSHLTETDVPADYQTIADRLKTEGLLAEPVIVSGVSEGAALAVLAASSPANHAWIHGVITMGLPAIAELAWKWTDFTAWITKSDAREPSFAAERHIAEVSPLPLVMIQSTKDEYVTEADYRRLEATAKEPKKLVLIAAANHRFTDKRPELQREYLAGIDWVRSRLRPSSP
ncbi:MAG: alpha/beta hydrolase family protein [Betaproteobacteria bacterium]